MFSEFSYPMGVVRIIFDQTRSEKSKMEASKPELKLKHTYQLVDKTRTKTQRLHLCPAIRWDGLEWYLTEPEVVNPRWRPLNLKNVCLNYKRNSNGYTYAFGIYGSYPVVYVRIRHNRIGISLSIMAAAKPEILFQARARSTTSHVQRCTDMQYRTD